jgi:1-deoxyxylulose-5-phosphate synthase
MVWQVGARNCSRGPAWGGRLAWVLTNPAVSAPIVGATKPHHLPEAVAALDMNLSNEEISALEEHYTPHGLSWF